MKLEVKQKRIGEDQFLKIRKDVLSLRSTGKEVDLDEALNARRTCLKAKTS
jgi:glutamate mutase epsilon subunit